MFKGEDSPVVFTYSVCLEVQELVLCDSDTPCHLYMLNIKVIFTVSIAVLRQGSQEISGSLGGIPLIPCRRKELTDVLLSYLKPLSSRFSRVSYIKQNYHCMLPSYSKDERVGW